ncbi:MAG: MogA/MoaB family molybdenum cofactor biosynthesis protein [Pyrinomonadaceae bacterium]
MDIKIKAVVITISDRCARGEQEDLSGKELVKLLCEIGAHIVQTLVVSDSLEPLINTLKTQADRDGVNLIVTTGGTGFSPRDNTPEATRAVIEREAPGLSEAMRIETRQKTPQAILSRAVCGTRNGTLIINLPGSVAGVRECLRVIAGVLPHAISVIRGGSHD